LPKGGGAIRGIDEKLSVTATRGTASLSVPVPMSSARQGAGPSPTLTYDSGGGDGPFGLGWGLSVPTITRKTAKGLPLYDDAHDSDVFILSGAEDLVPVQEECAAGDWRPAERRMRVGGREYVVRRYRPRVEAGFARIERWTALGSGEVHWRTISRANVTSLYGLNHASRITDPADPRRVFSWLLELSFDDRGNAIAYEYKAEDAVGVPHLAGEAHRSVTANRYLKRICYGNDAPYLPVAAQLPPLPASWRFQLVLDYGEHDRAEPTPAETIAWPCRPDPFSSYRSGFEIRTYRLCRRLLMFHIFDELGDGPQVVRSLELEYGTGVSGGNSALPLHSKLEAIKQTGWLRRSSDGRYETERMPVLRLGYSPLMLEQQLRSTDESSLSNLTGAFQGPGARWTDLDGEGLPGILSEDDRAWYYKRNVSTWTPDGGPARARFEALTLVADKPSGVPALQLSDLNGDGHLCAVSFAAPIPGWFEREPRGGWAPFRDFQTTANVDWASPHLRFVDLDGDGLADVLITEDDAFTWHRWIAETGFAPAQRVARAEDEEHGPALVLADVTASIFLADMSGDGLADLVRVRVGEVCYWPNLGYGRFGAKVSMDRAPTFDFCDAFDARRVRFADIDGSGTADMVYLADRATVWFNQSGNSWTAGTELAAFPPQEAGTQASVFDLLGTGTAALVWTSGGLPSETAQPLRYIDLTGGVKPYLLTSVSNGMGAHTTLTYAPSTRFYLEDRACGRPWLTRLPFPVHVVESMRTTDAVSRTSYSSSYSYHHGFYDGVEREFRGFACVETLDYEELPAQSGVGGFTETPPVDDATFHLPPVWTRTWYHTGAEIEGEDIALRLASEYYAGDPAAPRLGGTTLPAHLDGEARREAYRALSGSVLREEVYAQDGTPAAVNPYVTRQHRYRVDRLQPATPRSYGSYYGWQREAVACNYERDPRDPRIGHELTLRIDPFGNVVRSASIGYPRRRPHFPEQAQTWIHYRERDLVNVPDEQDWYRLGLPVEVRDFQLTGIAPTASGLYDPDTLAAAASAAAPIPYEQEPVVALAQRRLFARARTLYRGNDLTTELGFGQVQSLALVDRSYEMRFTPGLLAQVFSPKLSAQELRAAMEAPNGAFVELDRDGSWWSPSPRAVYSADPLHPDAAFAREHFYLPQGAVDPWGHLTTVAYDAYDLQAVRQTDAVGNVIEARINYRLLAPWLMTDQNRNRSGVRFDALGMVTATAAMGKPVAGGGFEGDTLDTSSAERASGDDPTTRMSYDLRAFETWAAQAQRDIDHPEPAWVKTEARVRHKDPHTPWLVSYAYTDGLGRIALTKAQAEPGEAPARDPAGRLVRDANEQLVFADSENRWVGSGRVVYDNKGNAIKAYEPFFDSSPAFDDESDLVEWGVTAITRYDPLGRTIRVDNPNGSLRRVEFDAWVSSQWDENDTVLESRWYAERAGGALGAAQADTAAKAAAHANTPSRAHVDPLGRTFRTVQDNGAAGEYATVLALDIAGRPLCTIDALDRAALTQRYSMSAGVVHSLGIDAGERWLFADAAGQTLRAWDGRGTAIRCEFDALRRPTSVYASLEGEPERVVERVSYGEGVADDVRLNLRGVAFQHVDDAGVATTRRRDFKGNVLSASRQLLAEYRDTVDWAADPGLEAEELVTESEFDALNRVTATTTPDDSVTKPFYNQRSLLASVQVTLAGDARSTSYVRAVAYDAKAQRQRIDYGNGATTRYTYDPLTFRLDRLLTTRPGPDGPLQDLEYAYDPVGNVMLLKDGAQQTIFFKGQVVEPTARYTYDAIYRLLEAKGREHRGQTAHEPVGWSDEARRAIPLPTDGQAMRKYTERWTYDAVGNIEKLAHRADKGGFTRTYAYDEPHPLPASNRLTSTTVGGAHERYGYDANGNIDSMPHLALMRWSWANQLEATARQAVNEGTPRTTYYRYDAGGQRVRKVTADQHGARVSERTYLGPYEIFREYSQGGEVKLERRTLHISDGAGRICLLETTTIDTDAAAASQVTPANLTRYQFGNLLGSSVLELDERAAIVSYEEYYPYGSTSFQSGRSKTEVSLKRYRYTGKERDEESGFYYHGARYYAPWLGRWSSADPGGAVDGANLYRYARDNPVRLTDASGMQPDDPSSDSPERTVLPLGGSAMTFPGYPDPLPYWDQVVANAQAAVPGATVRELTGLANQKEVFAWIGGQKWPFPGPPPEGFDILPEGSRFFGLQSGMMVQQALEGEVTNIHMTLDGITIGGRTHRSSELRQLLGALSSGNNSEVEISFQQGSQISVIPRGASFVVGAPLRADLAKVLPPSFSAPPPSGGGPGTTGGSPLPSPTDEPPPSSGSTLQLPSVSPSLGENIEETVSLGARVEATADSYLAAAGKVATRTMVPLAAEVEEALSPFGDPWKLSTVGAAASYYTAAGAATVSKAVSGAASILQSVGAATLELGSAFTTPFFFIMPQGGARSPNEA
jgi:RHS repeat-associated protein